MSEAAVAIVEPLPRLRAHWARVLAEAGFRIHPAESLLEPDVVVSADPDAFPNVSARVTLTLDGQGAGTVLQRPFGPHVLVAAVQDALGMTPVADVAERAALAQAVEEPGADEGLVGDPPHGDAGTDLGDETTAIAGADAQLLAARIAYEVEAWAQLESEARLDAIRVALQRWGVEMR